MSKNSVEKATNPSSSPIRIVILGSGFAAIEVLKKIQNEFNIDNNTDDCCVDCNDCFTKQSLQIATCLSFALSSISN